MFVVNSTHVLRKNSSYTDLYLAEKFLLHFWEWTTWWNCLNLD